MDSRENGNGYKYVLSLMVDLNLEVIYTSVYSRTCKKSIEKDPHEFLLHVVELASWKDILFQRRTKGFSKKLINQHFFVFFLSRSSFQHFKTIEAIKTEKKKWFSLLRY